ncbi:hypothetical protein BGZ76_010248 [Entomortierella beljakovae]|nr:hypothetical protein BGZ76_010248 [Entomortierella beljakovae]
MSSSFAVTFPTPVFSTIPLNVAIPTVDDDDSTSKLTLFSPESFQTRINVLELPEILSLIGQYISQHDAISCVLVCRVWHEAFQPVLWEIVKTGYDISPKDVEKHAHHIKNLSLASLDGLQGALVKCTKLKTLILWPDSFDDEEDEEDDDEEEDDEEEGKEEGDGSVGNGSKEIGFQSTTGLSAHNHLPQPAPILHPMESDIQVSGIFGSTSHIGEGSSRPGGKEMEKLRRDSGFGEETTFNLPQGEGVSVRTMEEEVQFLGVEEAAESLGFEESNMILPLRSLEYHTSEAKQIRKYQRPPTELSSLVQRNPNLTRIEVYCERKSPGGSFWRALSATDNNSLDSTIQYPRLSAFQSICNLQVYKHIKPFLQMCTQLESLDLEQCSLRQLDPDYYLSLNFSRMKELRFARIRDTSLYSQLLIMRQCPGLRTLDWKIPRLGFPVQEFCEALRDTWPDLKVLLLPESRLSDSELGQILRSAGEDYSIVARGSSLKIPTKGLTRFEVRRSDFGELAFQALKNSGHFDTLTTLDLYKCQGLSSWMIAEILQGCPLLKSFDGHQLFSRDVVSRAKSSGGDDENNRRSWVCRDIQYLDLHFTGFLKRFDQDAQNQRQVFAQIARLESLRYLSIGGKVTGTTATMFEENTEQESLIPSTYPTTTTTTAGSTTTSHPGQIRRCYTGGLSLQLDYGLEQLGTLKKLEILRFTGVDQKMEERDVLWMIENLPQLRIIQGVLHTDHVKQENLETLFESNNISVWTMFNNPASVQRPRQR